MANDNSLLPPNNQSDEQPAVELIRAKLKRIYGEEPNAAQELAEAEAEPAGELSKHQKFMLELQSSDKSLAQIQTDWHNYYVGLPDDEKRAVWQEFYQAQASAASHSLFFDRPPASSTREEAPDAQRVSEHDAKDGRGNEAHTAESTDTGVIVSEHLPPEKPKPAAKRRRLPKTRKLPAKKLAATKQLISQRAAARAEFERRNLRAKHNLQSVAFGLITGFVVLIIFMFSFFNENFIAPFIQPGSASATPIIIDPSAISPTKQPEIIIPKINVEIPLVFSVISTNESDIENALENGVVHYPTTVLPGQQGNTAYFGHSSNNIFSPGNYKFAFVLLHKLVPGDIFYITYNQKVYVYKVYDKQIVSPNDVGVLDNVPGKVATATLITCDPPGTSINRLVVWGEQISPVPSDNTSATASPSPSAQPKQIAGNGPSLLSRLWPF